MSPNILLRKRGPVSPHVAGGVRGAFVQIAGSKRKEEHRDSAWGQGGKGGALRAGMKGHLGRHGLCLGHDL